MRVMNGTKDKFTEVNVPPTGRQTTPHFRAVRPVHAVFSTVTALPVGLPSGTVSQGELILMIVLVSVTCFFLLGGRE